MCRLVPCLALAFLALAALPAQAADEAPRPAITPELLKGSTEDFIKAFDKNKDGVLSKDEVPERLTQGFDRIDGNSDGKLDKTEVERALTFLRQNPATPPNADQFVTQMLQRIDANKDGKISKDEAKNERFAQFFDRLDTSKDGFLDKDELKQMAQRLPGRPGGGFDGPARPAGPDFDALDKNADGRLTAAELKGTPFAEKFADIDANGDGKVDPREFAAYLKKQAN